MKKKGAETNDIDDIDESTANGGEIELRECSVEEGKEEEEKIMMELLMRKGRKKMMS